MKKTNMSGFINGTEVKHFHFCITVTRSQVTYNRKTFRLILTAASLSDLKLLASSFQGNVEITKSQSEGADNAIRGHLVISSSFGAYAQDVNVVICVEPPPPRQCIFECVCTSSLLEALVVTWNLILWMHRLHPNDQLLCKADFVHGGKRVL